MAATWKTLSQEVPTDGENCIIRVKYYYGAPFRAQWNEAGQLFRSTLGINYPAWSVARWKAA